MAKVEGPMMGVVAKGTFADLLVYATWKGTQYVRKHVIPANPKTAAQQAQRGRLTSAVAEWHDTVIHAGFKSALDYWALMSGIAQSGFNKFVNLYIDVVKTGKTWSKPYNPGTTTITAHTALCYMGQGGGDATMTFQVYLGTSAGYMPLIGTGAWNAGNSRYEYTASDLASLTNYCWKGRLTKAATHEGWGGIFRFKTTS